MAAVLQAIIDYVSWPSALLTVILGLVLYVYREWRSLPPGPVGIPYIGYYPFLKADITSHFGELAKKYGDVYCFTVTGTLYIHLSSLRSIREGHITKSEYFARETNKYSLAKDMFNDGLAFSNGEEWKVLRKFFIHTLKEFGMGKEVQESVVTEGINNTLDVLRKSEGRNVNALSLLNRNCNSTIRHLLFSGDRIESKEAHLLEEAYENMVHIGQSRRGALLLTGPLIKYFVFPLMPAYRHSMRNKELMKSILIKIIKEHEETFDKDHLRDLVDFYLKERKDYQERGDPKANIYTDSTLIYTLIQFFGDGSFAVGWLISKIIGVLANYPDVQQKIQSEIDEVVGRERLPQWSDRNRLLYTTAAIYEVQRTSDILPILPSLECIKDTTIQGHRIPRGAITLPNYWFIHHDPEMYENVDTFDPTRFMSTDAGKVKAELPNLFGIGKRSCAGEALTNMQVLLFVASIFQSFNLHQADIDPSDKGAESYDSKILIRATPRPS